MTSLSIFEIPPIQDVIASYLPRQETERCGRVSPLWRDAFTPYLYRTIEISFPRTFEKFNETVNDRDGKPKRSDARLSLARNHGHVRVIRTAFIEPFIPIDAEKVSSLPQDEHLKQDMNHGHEHGNDKRLGGDQLCYRPSTSSFPNLRRFEWLSPRHRRQGSTLSSMSEKSRENLKVALDFVARHAHSLEEVVLEVKVLETELARNLTEILRNQHPLQQTEHRNDQGQGHGNRRDHLHQMRKLTIQFDEITASYEIVKELSIAATTPTPNTMTMEVSATGSRSSPALEFSLIPSSASLECYESEAWDDPQNTDDIDYGEVDGNSSGDGGAVLFSPIDGHILDVDSQNASSEERDKHEHASLGRDRISSTDTCDSNGLKNLSMSVFTPAWEGLLLTLLHHSPDLEGLTLPLILWAKTFERLVYLLNTRCTNLKHLALSKSISLGDRRLSEILDACVSGLESFTALSVLPMRDRTVDSLIRHHGHTLTSLDLSKNDRWESHFFLDLISHCTKLTTLKASIQLVSTFDDGEVIDYEFRMTRTWPFQDRLKVLDLTLYRGSDLEVGSKYRPGDGSLTDRYIDYMYTQVGALAKLEELSLGGWMLLLRVEWGLPMLEGLKKLKVLDLRNHTFINWKVDEVEWICEHWTGLVEVWGMKSPNSREAVDMLKARRPFMEFK